eukprot:TRINITY_DN280_c0_g1_i1.p1 TRINITY_DN280_c0_g1~~TRINITY_DN280_c0_g1_i1.p1  ORF type:complete len:374 (+),score=90.79 TRINITY_DN280_c0_g1_i1:105-1226(+)
MLVSRLAFCTLLSFLCIFVAPSRATSATYGLFGLSGSLTGSGVISIDPVTGTSTPVGQPLPVSLDTAQGLTTFDPVHGLIYALVYDNVSGNTSLYSFSITDGSVRSRFPLPLIQEHGVEGEGMAIEFDAAGNQILFSGHTQRYVNQHALFALSLPSGKIRLITTVGDSWEDILATPHCFDPKNRLIWIGYGKEQPRNRTILAINVDSGKVVGGIDNAMYDIRDMIYDPKTQLIFGLGAPASSSSSSSIAIYTLEGTGEVKLFSLVNSSYMFFFPSVQALDIEGRLLYLLLEAEDDARRKKGDVDVGVQERVRGGVKVDVGVGTAGYENLVAFHLESKTIKTQPQFCYLYNVTCPNGIHHFPSSSLSSSLVIQE